MNILSRYSAKTSSFKVETVDISIGNAKFGTIRKVWIDPRKPTQARSEYQIRNLEKKVAIASLNWLGTTITVSHYQNREKVFFTLERSLCNRLFSKTPDWNLKIKNFQGMKRELDPFALAMIPNIIEKINENRRNFPF